MTYFCIGIFLLPFLKLSRCDIFLHWYFPVAIFKVENLRYDGFYSGIFILKTWGDVTYLQTRDDTSIKAPRRRQTICQICHKSAAFRFCRISLGIFHIFWRHIFLDTKKYGLLDFADAISCHWFFHNFNSKGWRSCAKEQAESKELHCHCTRL